MKIRVLASQFQLELIRRMGGSPIAMTLADVLPGLQQGTIDGTLTTMTIYTTMRYDGAGKYVINTDQPYVNSIGMMSKKWMDTLPPDLAEGRQRRRRQGHRRDHAVREGVLRRADQDLEQTGGGQIADLPKAEHDAMIKQGLHHRRRSVEVEAGAERGGQGAVRIGGAQQIAALAARSGRHRWRTAPGRRDGLAYGGAIGSKPQAAE